MNLQRLLIVRAIAALLAISFACGGVRIHAGEADLAVHVRVHVEVNRSIRSRVNPGDLKEETSRLWRPYGVQLDWTDTRPSDTVSDGFFVAAIVQRRIDRLIRPEWSTVLGQASVSLDAPSRQPILVSVDATERVLAARKDWRSSPGIVLNRELSRALGRVLAHEIGHVVLAVPYHDHAGLMRAAFRPDELVNPDPGPFRLTCGGVGRLRSRIRTLTGDRQSAPAVAAHLDALAGIDLRDRASCIPVPAER